MESITPELVQNIGVIGVFALCAFYFIKYMYDKNMSALEKKDLMYTELIKDERARHSEEMAAVKEALSNNTIAITKLSTLIENSEIMKGE